MWSQCSEQGLIICVFFSCCGQIQNTKLSINPDDHCSMGEATAPLLLYGDPTGPSMAMNEFLVDSRDLEILELGSQCPVSFI